MAIKKAFVGIIEFLEANVGSKVKTILPEVIELASAKSGGAGGESKSLRDADNKVTHVYCYYHKKWEPVADVEFGAKASSATGLNNMCKEGVSAWTGAVRTAKKANEQLLNDVGEGKVAPGDIATTRADIESARAVITPRKDGVGFETLEDVHASMNK